MQDGVVEGFKSLDTDCIGDVLYALGLNCIVQGIQPMAQGMKVCGRAATVREVPLQDPETWGKFETFSPGLIALCRPGDVLVIDVGGRLDLTPWGSNATLLAKRQGLNGVIIDGACRDASQVVEIGLPVFSRGPCVLHSHGLLRTVCLNNEPVQLGSPPRSTSVAPGDIVIGDLDGIVVVPAARAAEVLSLAQERHKYEETPISEWRAGHVTAPTLSRTARRRRIQTLSHQLGLKGKHTSVSGL